MKTFWRVASSGYFQTRPTVANYASRAWRFSNRITTLCARERSSGPCFQELQRVNLRSERLPARIFHSLERDAGGGASIGRTVGGNDSSGFDRSLNSPNGNISRYRDTTNTLLSMGFSASHLPVSTAAR